MPAWNIFKYVQNRRSAPTPVNLGTAPSPSLWGWGMPCAQGQQPGCPASPRAAACLLCPGVSRSIRGAGRKTPAARRGVCPPSPLEALGQAFITDAVFRHLTEGFCIHLHPHSGARGAPLRDLGLKIDGGFAEPLNSWLSAAQGCSPARVNTRD